MGAEKRNPRESGAGSSRVRVRRHRTRPTTTNSTSQPAPTIRLTRSQFSPATTPIPTTSILGACSRRAIDTESVYVSTWVGLAELALSGCTTSTDHLYLHPRGAGDLLDVVHAALLRPELAAHEPHGAERAEPFAQALRSYIAGARPEQIRAAAGPFASALGVLVPALVVAVGVRRITRPITELIDAGAEAAWNMYSKAGIGLASEVISYYKNKEPDIS